MFVIKGSGARESWPLSCVTKLVAENRSDNRVLKIKSILGETAMSVSFAGKCWRHQACKNPLRQTLIILNQVPLAYLYFEKEILNLYSLCKVAGPLDMQHNIAACGCYC